LSLTIEEPFEILKRWRVGAVNRLMVKSWPNSTDIEYIEFQADILLVFGLLETITFIGLPTFQIKGIIDQ